MMLWCALAAVAAAGGADSKPPRPSILVILADDLGIGDVAGMKHVAALAERGAVSRKPRDVTQKR